MNKLTKTIVWIVQSGREREITNLSKTQIQKLVYLIDIESRRFYGESFFDGEVSFRREKNGPLSVQIYDALRALEEMNVLHRKDVITTHYTRQTYQLELNERELLKFKLQEGEMAFLASVLNDYIELKDYALKNIAYGTEPMQQILEKEKGQKTTGVEIDMGVVPLDTDMLEILSE